jgi:hypothetical protein
MRHHLRSTLIALSIAMAASLAAATPAPATIPAPIDVASPSGITLKDPRITGKACPSEGGVTVVVDFRTLRNPNGKKMNRVKIGCARGAQQSGFTALLGAGFDVDPDSSFVCKIDNRPLDSPSCPAPDGYWAYSHGERGGDWTFSGVGAGDWQPPPGSLEGWSWSPYDKQGWDLPRVNPSDLFPPGPE